MCDSYVSAYYRLLSYLPLNRFNIFCVPFLRSLTTKQNLLLIQNLPDCPSVFSHFMTLLQNEDTFLPSFSRLFQSYHKIPNFLLSYFNRCFRNALKKSIKSSSFDVMLSIVFAIPKDPFNAIDFFFSAFLSDRSVLALYVGNMSAMVSFQIEPKCPDLPISYLKFILFTNIESQLSSGHIWSFFVRAPSLTFELIDRFNIENMKKTWTSLLTHISTAVKSSQLLDIQLTVFYAFLLSSIANNQLISIFSNLQLHILVDDLIFIRNRTREISERELALLSLYLFFCRLNETVSLQLVSLNNFKSGLSYIILNKNHFDIFVHFFIWVLNPTTEFPIEGINFSNAKDILQYLPPPSYTFSSEIAPLLLSLLMENGISNHINEQPFAKLIATINQIYQWEQCPNNLLLGIANEKVLTSIVPLAMESGTFFYLLTNALSISCIFPVFSNIYSKIANDNEKLLKFLITMASTAPLVNDFLRIDNRHNLGCNVMGVTVVMWVRFLSQPVNIAKIKVENKSTSNIYIKREANTFVLELDQRISKFIPMNDNIGGWYLICVNLTPECIEMSVNLARTEIKHSFSANATISIGKRTSVFDLQSFHVFRPKLSNSKLCRLFALGPNHKQELIENFLTFSNKNASFVSKNQYASSLYLRWISSFNRSEQDQEPLFDKSFIYSISPPFNKIRLNSKRVAENRSILNKRFYFESFFNSLDAHGGISLLIHFFSEIILKRKDLHSLAFSLFDSIVNRFPFIHYYFKENRVYQLIGQLLWKSSPDPKCISHCAMVFSNDGCIITNVDVVRYWFLGPSLFHCEFNDIIHTILTSLEGEFAEDNKKVLENANGFLCLIKSISNSNQHSEQFLSLLMSLALKITSEQDSQEHASIIIRYLLVYHFNPKDEISPNSTVSLVSILDQILFRNPKVYLNNLCSLLPMLVNSPAPVQNALYDLMLKYLETSKFDNLIVVLNKSKQNPEFVEHVSKCAREFISKANAMSYERFQYVTIPIIFLLSVPDMNDVILSIFSASASLLDIFVSYPSFTFDHIYRFLCTIFAKKQTVVFFGHEANSTSTKITPFSHFLLTLLVMSVFIGQTKTKLFLTAFYALDHGEYSMFIMAQMMNLFFDVKYDQKRLIILLDIISFLFKLIPAIIRERITDTPPYVVLFVSNSANFIDKMNIQFLTQKFVDMLKEISSNSPSVALQIVSIVTECVSISSLPNFDEIIYRLESPMSFDIKKTQKTSLAIDDFVQYIKHWEENDVSTFLTLYCNSVSEQTLGAEAIFTAQEENDEILEKWKQIFTELNFPGSQIFSKCPTKYGVEDRSTQYQIRRILFPLNPAFDNNYAKFWKSKYAEEPPEVRLTMREVFDDLCFSHAHDILFTGEAVRLTGISMKRGTFVVTKQSIKFYSTSELLVFPITNIKSVRLTEYQHQPKGFFVEDNILNSTLFAFETASLRVGFVESIEKLGINVIRSFDLVYIRNLMQDWVNCRLSNFDYLLKLNFLSGRTWCDFTQFPIFPWVYTSFNGTPMKRNFCYPFFAQTDEQQSSCQKYYQMTKEIDGLPHHYANYVSNVGNALYFLVRLEPFTSEEIEFQSGALDVADRTFQSFQITTEVMTYPGSRSTLELVPESYFMPEFLKNINNIAFPHSPIHDGEISDVALPEWGKNPHCFIRKMRKVLESLDVSAKLNEWIDLIWGVRRQGPLAEERLNVFPKIIFEFDPDQYMNDLRLLNAVNAQMHNCGQAPPQLFTSFHPQKKNIPTKSKLKMKFRSLNGQGLFKNNDRYFEFCISDKVIRLSEELMVKIGPNGFEIYREENLQFINFAAEISPTYICASGNEFVTAHQIPIIIHWQFDSKYFIRTASLRGHLAEITAIALNLKGSIVVAGHCDGALSSFCLRNHCFLRKFQCNSNVAVTKVAVMNDNSSVIVMQNVNNNKSSFVTLFSINGDIISEIELDDGVKDCVVTSFTDGIKTNYAFMLTNSDKIYGLSMNSLKIKIAVDPEVKNLTSLHLEKNKILFAKTISNKKLSWELF